MLASHNPGKLREFDALLAPLGVTVVSAGVLGLPEPEETGSTFEANALIKARAAATATGLPALADDSGLACDGLDGAPGVVSKDWAEEEGGYPAAMRRVRDELTARFGAFEAATRSARFVAVLALAWPDGHAETVRGETLGTLVDPPRGTGGFGYDPMFRPDGEARTFGEMSPEEKRRFSHRARATTALLERCFAPQDAGG